MTKTSILTHLCSRRHTALESNVLDNTNPSHEYWKARHDTGTEACNIHKVTTRLQKKQIGTRVSEVTKMYGNGECV